MVYQDRLETFIAAILSYHTEKLQNSFLIAVIFEVNIVAEQKQALLVTIFCFSKISLPQPLYFPLPYRCIPGNEGKNIRCGSLLSTWYRCESEAYRIEITSGETAAILSESSYILQVRYKPHLSDKARCSEASRFSVTKIWYAYKYCMI